jgi:restriction system protein
MAIPNFQVFFQPILKAISDGQEHRMKDVVEKVADAVGLSAADRELRIKSGRTVFVNRVGWARTSLKKAGLLDIPVDGQVRITDAGRALLAENLPTIDRKVLRRYPGFVEFITHRERVVEPEEQLDTPQESLEVSFDQLKAATKDELLTRLKSSTSGFFERAVMKVLRGMGYGMADAEARVTGQPGDRGIDGIISEDKLGLDRICFQAKRWENNVGGVEVRNFAGSMNGEKISKGIMITTAEFTPAARQAVKDANGMTIILVDGDKLAELMIAHKVGVVVKQIYEVTEISEDFFEDDR